VIRKRSEQKTFFVPPHLEKWGYSFFPRGEYEQANNYQYWMHWNLLSGCRINKYVIGLYYAIMNHWAIMLRCAMCTKHFDKLDIKNVMREFVLRKDNHRSLFGKYFILCWLSRTFCLSGLINGKNQQEARQMEGWLTEWGCRGSVAGAWDLKLTQFDNGRRQPACQVSPPSVHPFCRNSRFCPWPC